MTGSGADRSTGASGPTTAVVVPALDEAGNVGSLVADLLDRSIEWVVGVDNGSADRTAAVAAAAGALVISEVRRGYGYACAAGTEVAIDLGADLIAYIDADHSSRPDELRALLQPLLDDEADLVLGSRLLGHIEDGAMAPHQRFGNRVAAALMRRLYGVTVTDLGPYRAIRRDLIERLDMKEMTFGWPTEMTVKAAGAGARIVEVPVTWWPRREGKSKVSGTVKGSILAGCQILRVTLRHRRGSARWRRLSRRRS